MTRAVTEHANGRRSRGQRLWHPCRRTVDGASAGKLYRFRQLAFRRKVARDGLVVRGVIHEIRRPVVARVEHEHGHFQFKANYVDRSDVIGIARDEDKAFRLLSEGVSEQSGGEVDIRPLFLELEHFSHTVFRTIAIPAIRNGVRKPYSVSIVIALNDGHERSCRQCLKIDVLPCDGLFIVRVWPYSGSEKFDGSHFVVGAEQCSNKRYRIKPSVRWLPMEKPVVQVKAVDVCYRILHCRVKLQGPQALRLEALPRIARGSRSDNNPSRGSVGIIAHRLGWRKREKLKVKRKQLP